MKKQMASRESHWLHVLEDWKSSGQTALSYCKAHGINPSLFYKWRNALSSKLKAEKPMKASKAFLPVALENETTDEGLELQFPNGCSVKLKSGFDTLMVKQLIELMGG